MSIPVFDAESGASDNANVSSLSWSHTCSGSDRILLVSLFIRAGTGVSGLAATYNGVAMTLIASDSNGGHVTHLFALLNPDTGANTVSITWGTINRNCIGNSVSYTSASALGTAVTENGTTADASLNLTLTTNDLGISTVGAFRTGSGTPPTAVGNGTERGSRTTTNATPTAGRCAIQELGGSGTVAMDWTLTNNTNFAHIAVPVLGTATQQSNFFF